MPKYNQKLINDLFRDFKKICEVLDESGDDLKEEKNKPIESKNKTVYYLSLTTTLSRIFRIITAYVNYRLNKIKN